MCQIFWEVVEPTKTRKIKSNKHGSGNAYFLNSVYLFIVADDVWLWLLLHDRQGKQRGNKYCMGTVVAEGQRVALPWMDITLSTSYNKCHEWTSCWTSHMNKCRATGHRKYEFPDPCVIVSFFHVVIFTFVFSHQWLATPFRHFTYVITHIPTLPSFQLCHISFSNPSFASSTSQARHPC